MAPKLVSDAVPSLAVAARYRGAQRGTAAARCGAERFPLFPCPVSGERSLAHLCARLYPIRRGAALWHSFALRGALFPYATHQEEL